MYVSKILAGAIIGKAGVRINEIRARSGCVVKIEEVEQGAGQEGGGEEQRLISVVGASVEAVECAMWMLKARVDGEADKGRGRGRYEKAGQ
jgi:heterogeneous nuclear rnp K-like protein 2